MKNIQIDIKNTNGFVDEKVVKSYEVSVKNASEMLHNGSGKGSDF